MSNANNVTQITEKLAAPATKFTIQATLEGFPVVLEGEGKAADLRAIIDRLKAIGATPPVAQTAPAPTSTSSGVPRCPIHSSPMKASRQPGKFYCAKKAEDGEYCRETA